MVFIVLGCIVGGIVGQLGCSPCYGAVGTPPPHNLAHGHPLDGSSVCVCVCVCVCVGGESGEGGNGLQRSSGFRLNANSKHSM